MSAETRADVTNERLFGTLRTIRPTLARRGDDLREIRGRLGILEMQSASLSDRVDRLDIRLERLGRRLDRIAG